jgi:glyoxylase-like metal-dependent hydrolase (beta-lactamase superfamily II)
MKLMVVPVTPFQQNCCVLVCEQTNRAAVTDPGGDLDKVNEALQQTGASLEKVFLTHGHIDHCGQSAQFARAHDVPLEGPHQEDSFWIDQLPEQGKRFGLDSLDAFVPDRWLQDGDTVQFGNIEMNVLHCPGHTPGHVVFHEPQVGLAIVGDVLFRGSVGRTDFPRGDAQTLVRSIREKLWPLGNDTQFVPGHGPMSTFGQERVDNAFVADQLFND